MNYLGGYTTSYTMPFPLPQKNVPFTIYYKQGCPYSMMALETLKNLKEKNNKHFLFNAYDCTDRRDDFMKLGQKYGHKTFPMIFTFTEFIGGNDELQKLLKNLKKKNN